MRVELLELTEYDDAFVADDLISAVDASFWPKLGIGVTRAPGQTQWRVRADAYSGICRVKQGDLDLTVVIRPKLAGVDAIFLAENAYGQRIDVLRRPKADRVALANSYSDPVAALLIWYVDAVADFAARWLRRSYRSNQVTFKGTVRGRFLVSKYVAHNLATARSADAPCIVTERTIDTANNRILKAGLRQVAMLAAALPSVAARRAVRHAVNSALPRFAEVTDVRVGPVQRREASTAGPDRHYKGILDSTIDLLAGHYLDQALGATPADSFLWVMPTLFQEALRGVLEQSGEVGLDASTRPSAQVFDGQGRRLTASRVDPDYVLETDAGMLLLDAKYKEALRLASPDVSDELLVGGDGPKIRVSRHDVYQMVAYRQHSKWANAAVALAYPVVLKPGEALPAPYEVRGFGDPVYLIFMDVGADARTNLPTFVARVLSVASTATGSETSQGVFQASA
jgi:5-methylcytosine-specific restriction enzyme subunit McrC